MRRVVPVVLDLPPASEVEGEGITLCEWSTTTGAK
jgi:hypothetical protein